MPSLTGKLLASAVRHLVAGSAQMILAGQFEKGYIVEFDGALRIRLGLRGEQITVALQPMRRRCAPNYFWAAQADLNKAFLAATKEVFRLTYDQQVPTS